MMDCKEFERLIPGFIEQKLDYPSLKCFIEHMEQCPDCKEELTIQFLVTEGTQRLEDGGAFDLQKELNQRLEESKRKLKIHGRFMKLGIVMEVIAACLLVGIIVWILL